MKRKLCVVPFSYLRIIKRSKKQKESLIYKLSNRSKNENIPYISIRERKCGVINKSGHWLTKFKMSSLFSFLNTPFYKNIEHISSVLYVQKSPEKKFKK